MSTTVQFVVVNKTFRRKRMPVKVKLITGRRMRVADPQSVEDFRRLAKAAELIGKKLTRPGSSKRSALQNARLRSTRFR